MEVRIKKDLWRIAGPNCHSLLCQLRSIYYNPEFRYIYLMRKCQKKGFFFRFWFILLTRCSHKLGIQIPYETRIGEGFSILHFGQIIINPHSIIGKNCTISAGALIGSSAGPIRGGLPTIGDNVRIGVNAIIIGKVSIGNDCVIAPGAFVNVDLPPNSIAIGNPCKVITRDFSPSKKFIEFSVDDYK